MNTDIDGFRGELEVLLNKYKVALYPDQDFTAISSTIVPQTVKIVATRDNQLWSVESVPQKEPS